MRSAPPTVEVHRRHDPPEVAARLSSQLVALRLELVADEVVAERVARHLFA